MTDRITAERRGQLGILTLTRPQALNALDTEMAIAARAVLDGWRDDPRVRAVWLQGEGPKAFCAGGDVRAIVEHAEVEPGDAFATAYFAAEYALDFTLHTYPKPVIVWGHGLVLGGGVGMLLGGSVRIVTDTTRLAMPEIRIGLFPDVGASWFLARLGGRGAWMALTAARITAGDALDTGLADVFVPASRRDTLLDSLAAADLSSFELVVGVVAPFVARSGARFLAARRARLDRLVAQPTDQAVLDGIAALVDDADPWIAEGARTLVAGSPTSARVILAHLRRAAGLSFADALRADLDLAVQHVRRHDFHAGVRAVLIDKGAPPAWSPASWGAVTDDDVAAHLAPAVDPHPLAWLSGPSRHELRPPL
ncbi:MAG: enoyl-CoA hydratase/isomerase family protein [Alphaproteobacteria bacterium]|nr:enoyl-CoA hydratase/isomerase family protein [Alphaproteobacteria bacterium]